MSTNRDAGSSGVDARDNRRWLVGITISLASVAGLMLTTECLIAERQKAESASTHTPAGHGDF